mmetsp:Transcript_13305/g.31138  ORF Transcript_13305/g.31138 Transcript_13305/m.31138 type:complete len:901 (+) Transcript_13305:93-2795(+)
MAVAFVPGHPSATLPRIALSEQASAQSRLASNATPPERQGATNLTAVVSHLLGVAHDQRCPWVGVAAAALVAARIRQQAAKQRQRRCELRATGSDVVSLAPVKLESSEVVEHDPEELLKGSVPFTFEELGLHMELCLALLEWKPEPLETATHIQATAIPKILAGQDVVVQAECGSGKTLAYLLPAVHHFMEAYDLQQRLAREEAEEREKQRQAAEEEELAAEVEDDESDHLSDLSELLGLSGASSSSSSAPPWEGVTEAMCYRVTPYVGNEAIRPQQSPDEFSPYLRKDIRFLAGDEFMVTRVEGSPQGTQFLQLADGTGWVQWQRDDPRKRLSMLGMSFEVGQRVIAKSTLQYSSGDVVERGTSGTVRRVAPLVGVEWDDLPGVKAIRKPATQLRNLVAGGQKSKWAAFAPDTLIVCPSRELCEQVAGVARQLGNLLPEGVREKWTVGIAVGTPPGVGKKKNKNKEQWPFPRDRSPSVLVTTMEFIHYFNHRRQIPLWGNIRYAVYDEVDWLINSQKGHRQLGSIRGMVLRAARTLGHHVQTVAVAATVPSAGGRSAGMVLRKWMPHAVSALPRPEYLHRASPLLLQEWRHTPESFEERVEILAEDLKRTCKPVEPPQNIPGTDIRWHYSNGRPSECYEPSEKTLVFCHDPEVAAQLAEVLASQFHFLKVGLFIQDIGKDERRERLRLFREGHVMIMVTSNLLQRGVDIPDVKHVVQFQFARNVSDHIHRIGRATRGSGGGRITSYYNDGFFGGRLLAEAIQDVGDQRLDGLFISKGTSLRKKFKAIERTREAMLSFGQKLPAYLKDADDDDELPAIPDMDPEDDLLEAPDVADSPPEEVDPVLLSLSEAELGELEEKEPPARDDVPGARKQIAEEEDEDEESLLDPVEVKSKTAKDRS